MGEVAGEEQEGVADPRTVTPACGPQGTGFRLRPRLSATRTGVHPLETKTNLQVGPIGQADHQTPIDS